MSVVIFDMDGVIIDSEGVYLQRLKDFLRYKNIQIDDKKLLELVGSNSKRDRILFKKWLGDEFDLDKFYAEKKEYHKFNPIDYSKLLMPHIKETLCELKRLGHSISLASSSPYEYILRILALFEIREYFDFIVSGEDFYESKPNPEIYNYTKSRYVDYHGPIFVVEDSTLGIEAAKAANLTVIAKIDDRFGFDQSKADYKVNDLLEIVDIVD